MLPILAGVLPMLPSWRAIKLALIAAALVASFAGGVTVTRWYYLSGDVRAYKEQAKRMRAQQSTTNEALQGQVDEQRLINTNLADDLERLRKRADRIPEAARANCAGSAGSELSGEDASFLVREAARADELRAALKACYEYADAVSIEK